MHAKVPFSIKQSRLLVDAWYRHSSISCGQGHALVSVVFRTHMHTVQIQSIMLTVRHGTGTRHGTVAHLRTWKTLAIFPIALILFLIISFRAAISLGSSTAGEGRGGEGRGEEGGGGGE